MMQDLQSQTSKKLSRVFISHSSEDQEFSELVKTRLQSSDIAGWIDKAQIATGDDILTRMGEGLRTMDVLVVLISQDALESSMVSLEVNHGIWREVKEKKVIALPFIIELVETFQAEYAILPENKE
jgi:hypothetical protein